MQGMGWCLGGGAGLLLSRGGGGGEGVLDPNLVYQKWPDQIFPSVNFVFSDYGHFGLGRGGGGVGGGVPPPLLVFNYSKEALGRGGGSQAHSGRNGTVTACDAARFAGRVFHVAVQFIRVHLFHRRRYPPPPLKPPPIARAGLPPGEGGGGGRSPSDSLPPLGGGGIA